MIIAPECYHHMLVYARMIPWTFGVKKPIATMLPGVKLWGFKATKRKKSSLFDPTGKTGMWILAIHVDVWWQDSAAKKSAMS